MGLFGSFFGRSSSDPPQPELVRGPLLDRVIVHVTWVSEGEMKVLAPGELAFERGPQLLEDNEYHAWITAVKPADFNDFNRLTSLGHEFFHALGATHKEA